ncbi:SAM-dependent methyltransferase [Burkholderia savannae]|uniref:SAM-dependent methyltransferase n=1 Tax=Burkholderia savannae TaxID=1637837 RepID=A0ABR5TCC8_9BURK|nr:class I SAM-dependent methyltransferase [Burkholderia savannae]KWZ42646.1 SAM-dependent methyltransferase [Burkholderia savannae]
MKTLTIAVDGAPSAAAHGASAEASAWIRKWSHLVPAGGTVLDVAAGHGRHARWFAERGHPVCALEREPAALASLGALPGVAEQAADLEAAPWPLAGDARFAAVVVTNYLHRPLLPRLVAAVAPGGVLLYETFAQGNQTVGKPSNPAFLLAPGELLGAVRGQLRVVAFEDGFAATPRDAFVQRICAVRERAAAEEGAGYPRYGLAG